MSWLAAAALLAAAQDPRFVEDGAPPAPVSPIAIERVTIASGLRHPWSLAFLPGGGMLVTEKDGGLVRVGADGAVTAIAGMPDDLDNVRQDPRDNSGLFDIALHPDFAANGLLYLAYASRGAGGTTTRLIRARLEGDRLTGVESLFEATPRSGDRFHYGGALLIGPDGKLYLTVGERHFMESDNPPLPVSLDVTDRRGKIFRFELDGRPAEGNPDFGPGAHPALYALGIRAVQGMTTEPGTGRIWFSEHGSTQGDEINILAPGANYGWPVRTGGGYRDPAYRPAGVEGAAYTDPVHEWRGRTVAPTGLTFYTGGIFPEWRGDLIVAGLRRGYLMRLDVEDGAVRGVEYLLEDAPVRLRNVAQGPDGALYIVTDEADGKVIRLDRR